MGGLGLRSATRTSQPAFWASWADCLAMIRTIHPDVAALILLKMQGPDTPPTLAAAASAARCLLGVEGFEPPSWEALANGERPPMREPDAFEPADKRHGWQQAASRIERQHRSRLMPRLAAQEQALLRSQSGPLAGVAFATTPSSYLKRIESHLFRVLLLRRLCLPLPLSSRQCRCGRPLDVFGHHRAACARVGVLGRRGFAVVSAGARICREGGARVVTNALLRDFDLVLQILETNGGWRFWPTDCRFSVARSWQWTRRSCPRCTAMVPLTLVQQTSTAVLAVARRRKERTYPELVHPRRRARLVVLAGEVAGRWSEETRSFLSSLAKAKARSEPHILRKSAEQAWRMRWGALLGCTAARAFALTD